MAHHTARDRAGDPRSEPRAAWRASTSSAPSVIQEAPAKPTTTTVSADASAVVAAPALSAVKRTAANVSMAKPCPNGFTSAAHVHVAAMATTKQKEEGVSPVT
jgi:hypothetical protein